MQDDKLELLTRIAGHLGDLVCEVSRCADALDLLAIDKRREGREGREGREERAQAVPHE